jgi:hypothetical protein
MVPSSICAGSRPFLLWPISRKVSFPLFGKAGASSWKSEEYSLWAKDLVFVISDGYLEGMHAFLSSYHGSSQPSRSFIACQLRKTSHHSQLQISKQDHLPFLLGLSGQLSILTIPATRSLTWASSSVGLTQYPSRVASFNGSGRGSERSPSEPRPSELDPEHLKVYGRRTRYTL